MSTKFFTNSEENTLFKKFEGVFTYVDSIRHFDALVGYFRSSGYFKLRKFLDNIPKIRILVGINVDKLIKYYHERGQMYLETSDDTKDLFFKETLEDIQNAHYDKVTEEGIIQFLDDIKSGKIEIKAHPSKKIHAKVYIFRPENFNEHSPCEVITGSSNLTNAGMGSDPMHNYEFNVALRDYDDVKFATDEFEKLWEEAVPILEADASIIRKKSYLRDDFTPFELYMKMLMEYFGKRVEYDPYNIDLLLPDKFVRLKYQSDAANQGYAMMMKHNGFILADVVGLGKTIIACMIIKKFIYENGTHSKILVVVPPALETNWKITAEDFQIKNHFEFITIGSLEKILDKRNYNYSDSDKFDLIVVDESHKFRNDYTRMYLALQEICKRPRSRPSENGDTKKKIILISATPLNNRPKDIEHQLYLFQDKRNSTLENIRNLQDYFKPINDLYDRLSKSATLDTKRLKALFNKLRDDVIEPLVIRRTRGDIESNDEYKDDLKKQNIKFPKVDDPIPIYYNLDEELSILFYETVSLITGIDENGQESEGLGYYRYRAIEFLKDEDDKKNFTKGKMTVESISSRLAALMKTLLIKRLESSFFAFKQSLKRLQNANQNMLNMFDQDMIFIAPDLDINKLLEEGKTYEEIEALVNTKAANNKTFGKSSFKNEFIDYLKKDQTKIDDLINRWNKITTDPKLVEFKNDIDDLFFSIKKNASGKLVIFTESKETADELTNALLNTSHKVLTVNSGNRKSLEKILRDNFDANIPELEQKNDYNVIITTEVLAEGINLHRSNTIVNYDVPWNSTRLMQRIGRVNRIGSKADRIYVYNFYPSAQGNQQIKLVETALRKLQAFHTAFGEDNKIFSILEEKGEGALYGNKIIQEESELIKYLRELRDFKKSDPENFNEIAKIPNKARCGRSTNDNSFIILSNSESGEIDFQLKDSSVCYLKSDNHPGIFCLITPELNAIDLSFLQAAKLMKSDKEEKSAVLNEKHFEQVLAGLQFFKSEKGRESIQSTTSRNMSASEKKANSHLRAIIKYVPTEQKRKILLRAIDIIKNGTYTSQGFPRLIADYHDKNKSLLTNGDKEKIEYIDKLFIEVIDKYNLSNQSVNDKVDDSNGILNPRIVLTQSFI